MKIVSQLIYSITLICCISISCNNTNSSKSNELQRDNLGSNSVYEIITFDESLEAKPNGMESTPVSPEHSFNKIDPSTNYTDTIIASNAQELIESIRSNRLIRLIDSDYVLNRNTEYYDEDEGILFDSIYDFKLVGSGNSKLLAFERNATVLVFTNSYNICLENLFIGHTEEPNQACEGGVIKLSNCQNIKISDCKLIGSGTYGITMNKVYNLKFINSSITECTNWVLFLQKSRNIEFTKSKFYRNEIIRPNLSHFSNTREIVFINSEFYQNKTTQPELAENALFEILGNNEQIEFSSCTFHQNINFNWLGDKIKLTNCNIDSSKFYDFQGNYPNATK